jgi:transcriptional regulator with XRE-family HTH domain
VNAYAGTAQSSKQRLSSLLTRCRENVDRDLAFLGSNARHPNRIGKRLTQEEVAEAAGITREWYAALERGRQVRVSPVVLSRVADILAMTEEERGILFTLAVPELQHVSLRQESRDLLESMSSLHRIARRLFAASAENEVLTILSEAITTRYKDAAFCGANHQEGLGKITFPAVMADRRLVSQFSEVLYGFQQNFNAAQMDEAALYGVLVEPGQIGDRSELHRNLTVRPQLQKIFTQAGLGDANFLVAHVRSDLDYRAILFTYFGEARHFTEIERAEMCAFGDLASLALSQAPSVKHAHTGHKEYRVTSGDSKERPAAAK